jgi:uncharacterized RDD family membrane protein YckC
MRVADEQALVPTHLGQYAGFVTRLVSFVIDRAIVSLTAVITIVAIDYVLGAFRINELLGFWEMTMKVRIILSVGIFALLTVCYDIGFWLLAGQTLGKRVMGVRILRSDGTRLRFGNALRREIGYILSGILFLGYLWILFDNRRQGFHDKLAGTIVVYSWPEKELRGTFVRDQVQRFRHQRQSKRSPGHRA